jgi:hypothetical protein
MQVIKVGGIGFIVWLLIGGCVDPYTPDIKDNQVSLVVEALLTGQPGYHTVLLSRSSPLDDTANYRVSGARVSVIDDLGGEMMYDEMEMGTYTRWFQPGEVVRGRLYLLHIETTEGAVYESDLEQLAEVSPEVGDVYWKLDTVETSDQDHPLHGAQFYLDLDGETDQARNFRWELLETWEYNASSWIQYIYDGEIHYWPYPYIYTTCWKTEQVPAIFIASTKSLERNLLTRHPLHFVSEETPRLQIKYSLLVRQYSLSDKSYEYWLQVQRQNQESGGIYETQPDRIPGNIHNVDDPDEEVLGYFNISDVSEKRIFVNGIRELVFPPIDCTLDTINRPEDKPAWLPIPFYMVSYSKMGSGPPYGVGSDYCFDCRKKGGVNVMPDFWE